MSNEQNEVVDRGLPIVPQEQNELIDSSIENPNDTKVASIPTLSSVPKGVLHSTGSHKLFHAESATSTASSNDASRGMVSQQISLCRTRYTNRESDSVRNMLLNLSRQRRQKQRDILREIETTQDNEQQISRVSSDQYSKSMLNNNPSQLVQLLHDKLLLIDEHDDVSVSTLDDTENHVEL
jgi:hypothetical protein